MKWLSIGVLVCATLAAQTPRKTAPAKNPRAQSPAKTAPIPVPDKWPIQSLSVEGNRAYTAEQVLGVAGLKVGQPAAKPEFEAARDRLVATGAFETVGYKFEPAPDKQGYIATIQVTEVEPAFPVHFEELGVPDHDVIAILRARDPLFSMSHVPASKAIMDRYLGWIQEYLASKNITEKLAVRVTALSGDQYTIVFRPAKGAPAVAAVSFKGNQVVPQVVLRQAISGVAVGSPYTESGFREILDNAVRRVYEQRGRLRVAFAEIRTEPSKEPEGVNVFVTLDEGVSYDLGKVEIAGPTPVAPAALLKAGDFKTGDVANMDKVGEGLESIRAAVRRAGYLDTKVTSDRKIDDEKKTVDIVVHVDAGAQYTMGKLTLVGLDLDGEAEINRIWTMKEGKTFNPDYPEIFLTRVKEQGLFDGLGNTRADLKVDTKRHVADVTLTFKGEDPAKHPGRRGRMDR
ncbi:MAG TPA: POTRA domain-containing protein [Candidatus Solibacter sp.]|nr:POTRA domain-containing protein [Candidatus Solibacter sp.]